MSYKAIRRRPFRLRMGRRHGGAITVLLVCALPLLWAQGPDLPSAPVQEKVTTACTECHDAGIVMQQRLSKEAWSKEVDKMIKWGALVQAGDRGAFIDYLSMNFPVDKAANAEQRVAPARKR
jgi:hypothetical protein